MAKGSSPNLEDIASSIFCEEALEQWKHSVHRHPALTRKRSLARRFLNDILQIPRRHNILLTNSNPPLRNRSLIQLLSRPNRPPDIPKRLVSQSAPIIRDRRIQLDLGAVKVQQPLHFLHRSRRGNIDDPLDSIQKSRIYDTRIVRGKYHRHVSVDMESLSKLGKNLV